MLYVDYVIISSITLLQNIEIHEVEQVDILISKNQVLQILYLKHHDNEYKLHRLS